VRVRATAAAAMMMAAIATTAVAQETVLLHVAGSLGQAMNDVNKAFEAAITNDSVDDLKLAAGKDGVCRRQGERRDGRYRLD
jgi:hypothetical protein